MTIKHSDSQSDSELDFLIFKFVMQILILFIISFAFFSQANAAEINSSNSLKASDSQSNSTNNNLKQSTIRVGLVIGANNLEVSVPDGALLKNVQTGEDVLSIPAQSRLTFFVYGSGLGIKIITNENNQIQANQQTTTSPNPNSIAYNLNAYSYMLKPQGVDALFGLSGKLYRGSLLIRFNNQSATSSNVSFNAINVVDLEEYLLSVVPSEMPSNWPIEAIKAQAIAARSYAVANLGKHESDGYDLKANTDDQVYVGVSSENQTSNSAVALTSGLILKHQGQVISAFFHSTSGGYTEGSGNTSNKPLTFLKSVADYDDRSPYFTWQQKVKISSVQDAFLKSGINVGNLVDIQVVSRSPSMRCLKVLIVGSSSTKLVSGEEVRRILALPSTSFNLGCKQDTCFIAGRGFGHGLGLSQWGARALAENGYNAAQILTYYYNDVSLDYL